MWRTADCWIQVFDKLVIPFVGGFAMTLGKTIAAGKVLSFDDANEIALDMVLLGIGVIVEFVHFGAGDQAGQAVKTLHACAVDVLVAAVLLYLRYLRRLAHEAAVAAAALVGLPAAANPPVTRFSAIMQLILGLCAIIWAVVPS